MITKWIYLIFGIITIVSYYTYNMNYDAAVFQLIIIIMCQNFSIQNKIYNYE